MKVKIESEEIGTKLIIKGGHKLPHFITLLVVVFFYWVLFVEVPVGGYAFLIILIPISVALMLLEYVPFSYTVTVDKGTCIISFEKPFSLAQKKEHPFQGLNRIEVISSEMVGHIEILINGKKKEVFSILEDDANKIVEAIGKFLSVPVEYN